MRQPVGYDIHTLPAHWRDLEKWPEFLPEAVAFGKLRDFDRWKRAIEGYLKTSFLKGAAEEAGVSPPEFLRRFDRCVKVIGLNKIWGFEGLVKGRRVPCAFTKKVRNDVDQPEEEIEGQTSQKLAWRFTKFLATNPDIEAELIAAVRGEKLPDDKHDPEPTHRWVHRAFARACLRRGIKSPQYPASSKNEARQSVYRYTRLYILSHPEVMAYWKGKASTKELQVGTGEATFSLVGCPYDLVQMDAHHVDVIGTIEIATETGPMRIAAVHRIWLVLLIDSLSGAVLGWSVSLEEQVSAETIERALLKATTPWMPRELRSGLVYEPRAGLPIGMVPGIASCPIAELRLDNYSAHFANIIAEGARRFFGCHLTFGPVGAWWTNAKLERLFGILEKLGLRKFESTTGSSSQDRMRASNPVKEAVQGVVLWELIVDQIEVMVTAENVRRGSGRSFMEPFEVLGNHIDSEETQFLALDFPPVHAASPRLGWEIRYNVRIAGHEKGEKRNLVRPYVQVALNARFSNALLRDRFDLIGTLCTLHIRRHDMLVELFLPNGNSLGQLNRLGMQPTIHIPMSTRKALARGKNRADVFDDELLRMELEELSKQAVKDVDAKPNKVSAAASRLAELERQMGISSTEAIGVLKEAHAEREANKPPRIVKRTEIPLPGIVEVNFRNLSKRG